MTRITFSDVSAASRRLEDVAVRTELHPCAWASCQHRQLILKPENLQVTGSFKLRGAYNRVAQLTAEERARGVIAQSSGNHGRALAYAARRLGAAARVVVPESAPDAKIDFIRQQGAEVIRVPAHECAQVAADLASRHGYVLVPPFDDPQIIAGQGTVGLEIADEAAARGIEIDTVLVPVSGGGLISGVATAIKHMSPNVRVIGVEPELAADAQESLRRGQRVTWPAEKVVRTIADGMRMTTVGVHPFEHMQELVDDIITVTEEEIESSVGILFNHGDMTVEPSGAVTTAAYLYHQDEIPGNIHIAVISGGNISPVQSLDLRRIVPKDLNSCCIASLSI
ncbi:threonine/serine dehydratase [Streptomyces cacaoi]